MAKPWPPETWTGAFAIAEEQPSTVRVTLADGTQLTIDDPTIQNGSIGGVDLSDVRLIEIRSFSTGKTVALVIGVPVGLAIMVVANCLVDDHCLRLSD